jgi:hypothetical protein
MHRVPPYVHGALCWRFSVLSLAGCMHLFKLVVLWASPCWLALSLVLQGVCVTQMACLNWVAGCEHHVCVCCTCCTTRQCVCVS